MIERNVPVIPGTVFSGRDTHFRISFALPDERLAEGCKLLRRRTGRMRSMALAVDGIRYLADADGKPEAAVVPIGLWREIESEIETATCSATPPCVIGC